jgi:hypothetical protein
VAVVEAISGIATALEHSGLGQATRSSGLLYPLANMAHVLGAALLVGSIATFDIHVLGRGSSAREIYRAAILIAVLGFVLQIGSGIVLLSADAVAVIRNPAFLFKMAMLIVGLVNAALFHWQFRRAGKAGIVFLGSRMLAAVSLASWVLVLLAGRAIAYL